MDNTEIEVSVQNKTCFCDINSFAQNEYVTIEAIEGRLQVHDQVREYMDRGEPLRQWNYLDFFLGTYDGKRLKERTTPRGRTPNTRVPYKANCNRDKRCRIIRSAGHETMPYFPGQWFPKRDRDGVLFQASMLALLKPWYSIADLKEESQSWREAFEAFVSQADGRAQRIMENIQFYHECSERARTRQSGPEEETDTRFAGNEEEREEVPNVDGDSRGGGEEQFAHVVTEEDIQWAIDQPFSPGEETYAKEALFVGFQSGALECPAFETVYREPPNPATEQEISHFPEWEDALKSTQDQEDYEPMSNVDALERNEVEHAGPSSHQREAAYLWTAPNETGNISTRKTCLNYCQRMAFDIVVSHLEAHLRNEHPPQRLMIVYGPGGTGKTAMCNAILNAFADLGASHLLAKTAYSGVAASLIGGQTLHTWGALPVRCVTTTKWITHPGKEVSIRRKRNFAVLWLFIDEMSMLTTPLLDNLSQATGIVRTGTPSTQSSSVFGGLSIMLLGDFHQLPPVANSKQALYHSSPPDDSSGLGRTSYEQFDIVVKLEEQMRIVDPEWDAILKRARTGDCTEQDIEELKKLVLTSPFCDVPDFTTAPWNDAVLVTPRNGARVYWNEQKVIQHCHSTGHTHFIVYARDNTKQGALTLQQRLVIAAMKPDDTSSLPNRVDLAIGMKVMVLLNIDTDSDLANGSRGVITDIILDPREVIEETSLSKVVLAYAPAAILFRPLFGGKKNVPGLPPGIIPIFPS